MRVDEHPEAPRHPSGAERVLGLLARFLLVCAVGSLVVFVGVPALVGQQRLEQWYGRSVTTIGEWRLDVTGEHPVVVLGASGGQVELDRCDGTFTHLHSYDRDDIAHVWAAHNTCSGDVVLPREIGDRIEVRRAGTATLYEVVDARDLPKTWSTTDDLLGLRGELILQTCYFGEQRMRFIGLERLGPAER